MKTVKLQGIPGHWKGTPVSELKLGDIIHWNFGYTSTVIKLTPSKTGKTIEVTTKGNQTNYIGSRKMRADRLLVVNL